MLSQQDGKQPTLLQKGSPAYLAHLLDIYDVVTPTGNQNVRAACIKLPSNLQFQELQKLVYMAEDAEVVAFLKFSFLCGI